jgi:hypothetical protein
VKARFVIAIAVVLAAGVAAWWWFFGGADVPVTDGEARAYLSRIVATAKRRDFDALCRLNSAVANCRHQLQVGCDNTPFNPPVVPCTETVPREPPTVVATRYHKRDTPDGTPGRILVVTGTDGLGRAYKSELMVFRENRHHFKAINAVYWSNASILENDRSLERTAKP